MTAPAGRARALVDAFGIAVLFAYITAVLTAAGRGGDAAPVVALLLGSAAALSVGRALGRIHRALVPAAVLIAGIAVAVSSRPLVGGGPLAGPFGYRNATGAYFAQAAVASLMVAAAVRRRPLRALAIGAAAGFAFIAAADSAAAGSVVLTTAIAGIGLRSARAVRASVALSAGLLVAVLAGTVILGAAYRPGSGGVAARALTERRLALWRESLQIIARQPGGVGLGRFGEVSPTAIRDPDARHAHDELLEQGVELGWAGLVVLPLAFLWGFARLWAHPRPDVIVALGAAALATLGIQASVDYLLHFPAVPLTAAALVGAAQAAPTRRLRLDPDDASQEGLEAGGDPARFGGAPAAG